MLAAINRHDLATGSGWRIADAVDVEDHPNLLARVALEPGHDA
jgi:hypothetical protein